MWTWLRGASRAKTLAARGGAQELTARGLDSGARCSAWFARFDPASSSWRTPQACLSGGWTEFSETWPRSGSMRNGRCFRRAPWVRHIHESGCSSLPTPTASSGSLDEILPPTMQFKSDRNGKPRKLNRNGKTWSSGLGRLFKMATGRSLPPAFVEMLMGFPRGWTSSEDSEIA